MAAQMTEPAEARPFSDRFRELDGLRGLAALAVVLSHFAGGYNSHFVEDPSAVHDMGWGAYGVQLFFLVSGFVILMSARRARRASDFVISRASRLYPVYWLSLGFAVILLLLWPIPGYGVSPLTVLINTTMVQRWVLVPNIVDVYWTLAVEMQFYVIILALLMLTACRLTDRVVLIFAGLWSAISWIVAFIAMPHTGTDPQLDPTMIKILNNVTVAEYAPLFVAGMALYVVRSERRHLPWAVLACLSAIGSACVFRGIVHGVIVAGVVIVFATVVLRGRTGPLLWSPLQFYGRLSYSLYVVHAIPGYLIIHWTWPIVGRHGAMILALIVVTLLAWALHQAGERWGSRVMKHGLRGLRSRIGRSEPRGRHVTGRTADAP